MANISHRTRRLGWHSEVAKKVSTTSKFKIYLSFIDGYATVSETFTNDRHLVLDNEEPYALCKKFPDV